MKLQNKICAVTGGGSGIGRAMARLFAQEGGTVVILDKDARAGRKVLKDIQDQGGEALFIKCDVSRVGDVKRAVASFDKKFRKLDVLVNNAGIYPGDFSVEKTSEALWDKVLAVNLTGPFLLSKYSLPLLKRSPSPSIINIASVLGLIPEESSSAYCVSKAGVVMLTKVLAVELAPKIRVNAIAPGPIDTPLLWALYTKKDMRTYARNHTLFGRLGTPEEVAKVALFLASDDASYVTGAIWPVDGGEAIA